MLRGTKVLMLFAALATIALVAVQGAVASQPTTASGTFTYTSSTFNSIRSAGGNTIIALSATVSYTGTFSGTSRLQGTLILHADGSANFHDVEIFTGTVNNVSGTVTFNLTGRNGPSLGPPQDIVATDTIVSATGDLAGLHGVLRGEAALGAGGPFGIYTGQIQFGSP